MASARRDLSLRDRRRHRRARVHGLATRSGCRRAAMAGTRRRHQRRAFRLAAGAAPDVAADYGFVQLDDVQTPALLLNVDVLERNLSRMAELAREAGKALRPHSKTHKSPVIAKKQIEHGAVGICTAKVGEAEIMVASGIEDVLITSEPVPRNMDRFMALGAKAKIAATVDDAEIARELGRRAVARGIEIAILVDVNDGRHRDRALRGRACRGRRDPARLVLRDGLELRRGGALL